MIEVNPDLLAFLREEEARAVNEELLLQAETAIKSYNGELYGDEEDGRSQVVARDVAESLDPMTIAILKTCVSGPRVVEFEPTAEGEEQDADDATEWMHRQFQRKKYRLLHDWIKAGLRETLGFVKATVEIKKERAEFLVPEFAIPEDAIEAEPSGEFDEFGNELWRAIRLVDGKPYFCDYFVPLEEMRVSPDTRDDLEESPYIGHATPKTISDLVEMGFPLEAVQDLQDNERPNTLSLVRDNHNLDPRLERTGVLRKVTLLEEYVRFDADGDGIAERLCIHRVGNTILSIERCDFQPFAYWCPYPEPGRLVGQSFADKAIDIQRVNTVLERLMLDGLYYNLAPGTLLHEGAIGDTTIDDLLNWRPNRIVRWTGSVAPIPEQRNEVSGVAQQAIEFKIKQREARTGISRFNQGLDPDALRSDTAHGAELMNQAAHDVEEFLARNFICGLADLMAIKLKLASRYGQPVKMRVDGEYRDVDPSRWNDGMEIIAHVGLGTGRKEQRLAYRQMILGIQAEAKANGSPIVDDDKIYNTAAGLIKDAGLGSPSDYFNNPAEMPPQQPQPDPETMKAQAELQMQQAKIQGEQQIQAAKMQGDQQIQAQKLEGMRQEALLKAQLAQQVAETDAQLARDKAEFEAQQAREKFEFEKALAMEKLAFEERRAARDAERRDYETDAKVSSNRPGGKLDE